MKVLVIEDEQFAADKLIKLLQQCDPSIQILDQLDTVEDSVQWLAHHDHPELIFMDIHLADGSSFDIFEQTKIACPVIFTTAYDQYAIQAFHTKGIDYLLKPIKYSELKSALDKFDELFGNRSIPDLSHEMTVLASLIQSQQKAHKSRFLIKMGNTIKTVSTADIAYFIFEDRLTLLITKDNHRYPVRHTLDELEELLDPHQFNRANRQFVINIDAIHKIHPWFKGRLKLDLAPKQAIDLIVSADKTKGFKEWLDR